MAGAVNRVFVELSITVGVSVDAILNTFEVLAWEDLMGAGTPLPRALFVDAMLAALATRAAAFKLHVPFT